MKFADSRSSRFSTPFALFVVSTILPLLLPSPAHAQQSSITRFPALATVQVWQTTPRERLPRDVLDVAPPSLRVTGTPGNMRIVDTSCRNRSIDESRRRIVNAAVQEWAFFGFTIDDMRLMEPRRPGTPRQRPFYRMSEEEVLRVAASVGGYWAAAPGSGWILERQNDSWSRRGLATRWRDPWSAAFISWVMCESGLGEAEKFQRAVAHHTYIDQAILARDAADSPSAFVAYAPGETPVVPGDLLCRGNRPAYASIADRREHLGEGARTHCDIVVKVDEAAGLFHVIGGNVRGSVRMKLLPGANEGSTYFGPMPYAGRRIFAHLKLRAAAIEANALDNSPTLQALGCNRPDTSAPVIAFTSAAPSAGTC